MRTKPRSLSPEKIRSMIGAFLVTLASAIVFVGLWHFAVIVFEIPSIVLPTPAEVGSRFTATLETGRFWSSAWATMSAALTAFGISSILAVFAAAILAEFPLLKRIFMPYIVIVQSLPKIAVAPLLLVWFGFGSASKVATAVTVSFFPIFLNAVEGFRATPSEELELLQALNASRRQIFLKAKLRNALPSIVTGLDLGIIFSLLGTIVGEFVGARAGLGVTILVQQARLDVGAMFATLAVLAAIGLLLHAAVEMAGRKIVFWRPDSARSLGI